MNILVTGSNGQLGNELRIATKSADDHYIFTDICDARQESVDMINKIAGFDVDTSTVFLDITDIEAVRSVVNANNVKVIINCAAYTNVDAAEDNFDLAELLNAKAPENLAVVMKEVGGLLVHISTDYVFGGDLYNTPCKEHLQGTPTGVYGLTKLHGEQAIQTVDCKHIIIRTSWLYSEFGKNFVKTMLNLITIKQEIKVIFDQVGTPTYARDLASLISYLLRYRKISNKLGIYNYSNEGVCSWYDFAMMIADYSQRKTLCKIKPCHSDEYPSIVKRPYFSVLDKTKIKESFDISIPYWTESLKDCINHLIN